MAFPQSATSPVDVYNLVVFIVTLSMPRDVRHMETRVSTSRETNHLDDFARGRMAEMFNKPDQPADGDIYNVI